MCQKRLCFAVLGIKFFPFPSKTVLFSYLSRSVSCSAVSVNVVEVSVSFNLLRMLAELHGLRVSHHVPLSVQSNHS
jgi:hypothetical protein